MTFAAQFRYTHDMVRNLGRIELARGVIKLLPLPPDQAVFLRHRARFRSMMSSTAIEGNTLTDQESLRAIVRPDASQADMQQERRNYWRAMEWIEKQSDAGRPVSEDFIRELHCLIDVRGVGRRGRTSSYRTTECPIVDSSTGLIDYAPPKPRDVPHLMSSLMEWLRSAPAADLPVPIRAGLLAHRFVSIHPFNDGNGRTARALATSELWLGGCDMRGFLSLEEFYAGDRARYYRSLQMGLPVDYYQGRQDPDHTVWLEYFVSMMAEAADLLRRTAEGMNLPRGGITTPWEALNRQQQQLLNRVLMRLLSDEPEPNRIKPAEVSDWCGVSGNTAREWLRAWVNAGFIEPTTPGAERFREYRLVPSWLTLVEEAARTTRDSTSIRVG
jgi:Fic family protein